MATNLRFSCDESQTESKVLSSLYFRNLDILPPAGSWLRLLALPYPALDFTGEVHQEYQSVLRFIGFPRRDGRNNRHALTVRGQVVRRKVRQIHDTNIGPGAHLAGVKPGTVDGVIDDVNALIGVAEQQLAAGARPDRR